MSVAGLIAGLALAIWVYLTLSHGRFWRPPTRLPAGPEPPVWPSVVAVVPARDEADVLPTTLPTLVAQAYPGGWRVVVVDDDSRDGTAEVAAAEGAEVVRHTGPPPGWVGKVAAMAAGVEASAGSDYVLFTDADIAYPTDAVEQLVRAAVAGDLDLTSQMVRLRAESRWERVVVPAFVYFFAQLYPFGRVNGTGRTAAAAGGCMLVRRSALARAGGLAAIRDAIIDDVALGRLVKGSGGRLWLGMSAPVRSVRAYPRLADLWDMVARSAYTQLWYSPLLLAGTVLGLLVTYLVPPVAVVVGLVGGDALVAALGGAAGLLMTATYVPMLRRYGLNPARAVALPGVAALYLAMTLDSARRHAAGRGAAWKGRVATRRGTRGARSRSTPR